MTYPKEVTLHVGGVHASSEPTLIKTLLGSCVAVCLWDPRVQVGGMNHFLLPDGDPDGPRDEATRFGAHAMDCLVGEMLKLDNKWGYNIIKSVGNYGEVFDRALGEKTRLGMTRGPNTQWNAGGLLYAPPFR